MTLSQLEIQLIASVVATACALPGVFLVLRRMALMSDAISHAIDGRLTLVQVESAKAAATIMAMNNVYYRAVHLAENVDLSSMPARLRMNVIGKPGIPKIDFELACLAVSAMTGCGAREIIS